MKLIRQLLEQQAVTDFKSLVISLFQDCEDETEGKFDLQRGFIAYDTMPHELMVLLDTTNSKLYDRLDEYFSKGCRGVVTITPIDGGLRVAIEYRGHGQRGMNKEAELTFELNDETMKTFVELKLDEVDSFNQLVVTFEDTGTSWRAAELA